MFPKIRHADSSAGLKNKKGRPTRHFMGPPLWDPHFAVVGIFRAEKSLTSKATPSRRTQIESVHLGIKRVGETLPGH
jgi:hypothetical protein